MTSPGRPVAHRARSDMRFLVDASPYPSQSFQPRTSRDSEYVSRSYPGTSSMSSPIMGEPPSPILLPERPARALSPDLWNLSSPNASEMPSPLRKALVPMLSLAREARDEALVSGLMHDAQSPEPARVTITDDASLSRRNSSRVRSSPSSPPHPRSSAAPSSQGHRKYQSPRVETDSDEEATSNRSWRTPTFERIESDAPRTPPPQPPLPSTSVSSSVRTSPRRSTKTKQTKRSSVAQRRIMESNTGALSSDGGMMIPSPLAHSPLVSLPLPDIPQSASDVERLFYPPERPMRSQHRTSISPIPSPSQSPLALQPIQSYSAAPSRPESPQTGSGSSLEREEDRRPDSPTPSALRESHSRSNSDSTVHSGRASPASTLAQTRPVSPTSDPRASPKTMARRHPGSDKQLARSPSPVEEPAVRHSMFYMEDEMVILRVENTLFRVHRYFLERDSAYFKDFFRHALVHGAGKTDSSAVRLPDVSRREFECLLRFLYHGSSPAHASDAVAVSILDLVLLLSTASALSFPAARAHAISALDAASPPLDPVERVFLAEKYAIPEWRRPAYVELCGRAHPLEDAEAEVLGLQTTARLARARERVLEEKVDEWRRAVERVESGQGVSKEDMQVREAKLVERVVDEIFAVDR
ncbi:hypothetical protein C8Q80DRAFT_1267108 [Daedaleopsis nitida]|nr:hypothetical protein C8Q80DRAFT_1267108 [Daedaleopsis nitida]